MNQEIVISTSAARARSIEALKEAMTQPDAMNSKDKLISLFCGAWDSQEQLIRDARTLQVHSVFREITQATSSKAIDDMAKAALPDVEFYSQKGALQSIISSDSLFDKYALAHDVLGDTAEAERYRKPLAHRQTPGRT